MTRTPERPSALSLSLLTGSILWGLFLSSETLCQPVPVVPLQTPQRPAETLLPGSEVLGAPVRFPIVTETDSQRQRAFESIKTLLQNDQLEAAQQQLQQLEDVSAGRLVALDNRRRMDFQLVVDLHFPGMDHRLTKDSRVNSSDGKTSSLWRDLLTHSRTADDVPVDADQSWKRGNFEDARQVWLTLLNFQNEFGQAAPGSSVSEVSKAEILKRLIVADGVTGRLLTARKRLNRWRGSILDVDGSVAGRTGNVGELLERWLDRQSSLAPEGFITEQDSFPFQRTRFDFVEEKWSRPVEFITDSLAISEPVIWNDVLLVSDQLGLRALNLFTGEAAWPVDRDDAGSLIETPPLMENREIVPFAQESGSLVNDLWIGRTGVARFVVNRVRDEFQRSRVFAIDLQRQGQIRWTVAANDLRTDANDAAQWIFSGPPKIEEDLVVIPLRSAEPDYGLRLVAFDQASGELIWDERIGSTLGETSTPDRVFLDEIHIQDQMIFWNIDQEAVAGLDLTTGRLLWVTALPSQSWSRVDAELFESSPIDGAVWGSDQALFARSKEGVARLDPYTGDLIWHTWRRRGSERFLGVHEGQLIAVGSGLASFEVERGDVQWEYEIEGFQQPANALLFGGAIFAPTGDEVWTIDAHLGQILQRDFTQLLTGHEIESVAIRDSLIIATGSKELTTFKIVRIAESPLHLRE
ncbi:Outer membrane protein assembly factor BamB [Thalassoglobus neptunius]|uniref:Outer membrane protein assembly factor BamB n=1 Tax=Thalassoglobus neptunius TaxID=1938619 RepID=A0A5C5X8C8_9PLAN|nr:PQQ-binding-like beta-propeller repeat protein [Thalassoglobus neptunius]TWT59134.1 Outer membrane protein assembly factor BamB [Thalassoglobus neptunius]